MNRFKKILQVSCSVFPIRILTKLSGVRLLLPYHHVVSDESLPHIEELYAYKNKNKFIKDLEWLLKNFEPIHPDNLEEIVFHKKLADKNYFLLSFDDGLREVYDVIAPILLEKGVPALFFANSDFIDNKNLFYRSKLSLVLSKAKYNSKLADDLSHSFGRNFSSYPKLREAILKTTYPNRVFADELGKIADINFDDFLTKNQPYLTSDQIKKLHGQGFVFGGHSIDHPHFKFLNIPEQCNQTIISTEFAKQLQQSQTSYFAFPHEDFPVKQDFFQKMNQMESNYLFFGTQNQRWEEQNRVFHRFNAERPDEKIEATASLALSFNIFLRLFNKQKVVRE